MSQLKAFLYRHYLHQSPQRYLLLYLGFILFFAVMYTFSARAFYHPYYKYEPTVREEQERISQLLKQTLQSRFKENSELGSNVTVVMPPYSVSPPSEIDDQLHASVLMILSRNHTTVGHTQHFLTVPIVASYTPIKDNIDEDTGQPATTYISVDPRRQIEETNFYPNPPEISRIVFGVVKKEVEQIRFTPDQLEEIYLCTVALSGFPHSVPGKFLRMLYFSVITITTVGYGDIVPLTPWARFLAGLEATLGIVQLGLFINSLGSQSQAPPEARRTNNGGSPELASAKPRLG
jgi:hypothetical protein